MHVSELAADPDDASAPLDIRSELIVPIGHRNRDAAVAAADRALYEAKAYSFNRTVVTTR